MMQPRVYLVGAGPGTKELLTLRAVDVIAQADVVVFDYLVEPSVLSLAPVGARLIDVGKRPGKPTNQGEINTLLVQLAKTDQRIVRLKGGDPFIFGRGGEEIEALQDGGVAFEVVPGVSSSSAVATYGGIPLTHRDVSQGFLVITGHSRSGCDLVYDWAALVRSRLTLVVLMGVAHRSEISSHLVGAGMDEATPVAAVSRGATYRQKVIRCTLVELGDVEIEAPAVIVIGGVASKEYEWLSNRPLFGLRVVVTRDEGPWGTLSKMLQDLGADVENLKTIEISDPSDHGVSLAAAVGDISRYDWLLFTSAAAVSRTFSALRDLRRLGDISIAAIGSGTKAAVEQYMVGVDFVPSEFVGEVFADEFPVGEGRVLMPRAKVARDVIPLRLRDKGWTVDVVEAYETRHPSFASGITAEGGKTVVLFTSPSTVDGFIRVSAGHLDGISFGAIGPITARRASGAGIPLDFVADTHSFDGLVKALCTWFEKTQR